ncbi:MAG: MBL fold metallo-hydrolase [Anaerolineae bacterium]|jgi:anaerobic nitric oxide reductase flavorubredoxin
MVTELAPGIYWVGVVDWALRAFHGHELSTHRGTSYNAYLIVDEKVALVDTVWEPFADELLAHIREIIDPAQIDYVVVNHGETDHAGSLPAVLREAPNAQAIVSRRGAISIPGHHHQDWPLQKVRTGDTLPLGKYTLTFVDAPMLHWPDSMFTYVDGAAILMPNDAFGQHYATAYRFNDQVDQQELFQEAQKYYANILTPFSDRVLAKIDELLGMNLPVTMIAPSHGVIWRDDPLQIVTQYQEWARQEGEPRAVILYDTMWEATRRMGEAIGQGLLEGGVPFRLFHMAISDRNDVIAEIFRSKAVIIGSPTLNRGLLPTISPILADLKGLGFKNKVGAAFGSYGWSGEGVAQIEEHLRACDIPVVAEGVRAMWQPTDSDLDACRELGRQVAQAVVADPS